MPRIRFYATKEDLTLLFENMFSELGLSAYEMYSDFGEPLRRFQTVTELSGHFRFCSKGCYFVWWDAESMPPRRPKKLELDPEQCDGHTFRFWAEFALLQVETGLKRSNMLTPSQFRLMVNWQRFNGKFNKLRRFIERSSVGKVDGCLVMPGAYELVCTGGHLTESIRVWFDRYGKNEIKLKK